MRIDPSLLAEWRLVPGTEVIPVDKDSILLRSFSGTLMISGEFVGLELVRALDKAGLDAPLSALKDQISDRFSDEFESFVTLLGDKGLLLERPRDAPIGHDEAYWQSQGRDAATTSAALAAATVLVVGMGQVGLSAAGALARGGTGQLLLVDSEEEHAEAAAAACRRIGAKARSVAGTVDGLANWEELVAESDLVVVCSDDMSLAGYDRANESCNHAGKRWTSVRIDRTHGLIGPFVIPGQTACFACYDLRSRANARHPSDHEALGRHRKSQHYRLPGSWPIAPEFGAILGNLVAMDVRRVLAGGLVSTAFGRVIDIDLHSLETEAHEILKLPRCPVCSRARERPLTRIWDLSASKVGARAPSEAL